MGASLRNAFDFSAAIARRQLGMVAIDINRLVRLSRYPATEPYWSRSATYRFDDPAQTYGVNYAGLSLPVAFAETVLHQSSCPVAGEWLVAARDVSERHIVRFTRPQAPRLLLADLTGANLKALGLNNDLCASDDYTEAMAVSAALHQQAPHLDGIYYVSRQLNNDFAVALFERSGAGVRGGSFPLEHDPTYADLLDAFNVTVLPSGRAPSSARGA